MGPSITAENAAARPPDLGAFLTTGRPARGIPVFNLLAQAMNDLVRYRSVAKIVTNDERFLCVAPQVVLTDDQKRIYGNGMRAPLSLHNKSSERL